MSFDYTLLDKLTADERREVQARLALQSGKKAKQDLSPEDAEFWDLVCEAAGLLPRQRQRLSVFVTDYGRTKFQDRLATLDDVLNLGVPAGTSRTVRMAVKRVALSALVEMLTERSIPVTAKTLLNSFDRLQFAVDLQFPGYIRAKLLHKVARAAAA